MTKMKKILWNFLPFAVIGACTGESAVVLARYGEYRLLIYSIVLWIIMSKRLPCH